LIYRYVPAVGKPGQADAAYPVLIREGAAGSTPRVVEKTTYFKEAEVKCTAGDWQTLPTLHHIAAGLAEIPIYGVIEAKVEGGRGVDPFANAERIE
jgi:hypothetical protein